MRTQIERLVSAADVRNLSGVKSFLRGQEGSTAVEYAIFLALVLGGVMFGSELLGVTVRTALADSAIAAGGSLDKSERPTLVTPTEPAVADEPTAGFHNFARIEFAIAPVLLAIGGVIWWYLYVRRMAKLEEHEAAVDSVVQSTIFNKRQSILKILSGNVANIVDQGVTVGQLMSAKLTTVPPEMTFAEVEKLMVEGRRHHLLVTNPQNELLGVISDRDVSKRRASTAGELMTPKPITVTSTTLIGPAVTLMLERRISCLPVVDGRLMGVLTTSDLIMALQCTLQLLGKIARASHDTGAPSQTTLSQPTTAA